MFIYFYFIAYKLKDNRLFLTLKLLLHYLSPMQPQFIRSYRAHPNVSVVIVVVVHVAIVVHVQQVVTVVRRRRGQPVQRYPNLVAICLANLLYIFFIYSEQQTSWPAKLACNF